MTKPATEPVLDERPQRRREYSGAGSTLGVAALVILAVGLGIWFFEVRDDDGNGGGAPAGTGITELPPELNTTGKPPAAETGRAAPNFKLETLDGRTATLSDFRGSYVLVNFWASWCGPCRGETPDLQALAKRTASRRFLVLGVNQQESKETAQAFVKEFGLTYPVVLDRSGAVSEGYRVGRGLPVSFLVSPEGVILRIYVGRIAETDLENIEKEYLGG